MPKSRYKQKDKEEYLRYYDRGGRMTFGKWLKRRKEVRRGGGSRQVKEQRMNSDDTTYQDVSKYFRK